MQPVGPGSPFVCLFDDDPGKGPVLPEALQAIYGRWPLPEVDQLPYTYVNFVCSRDGRVSFNEPGKSGGGYISLNNWHDRWLMALLRARADAIIMSANELGENTRHTWRPESIFGEDRTTWAELRRLEERAEVPLHVVVTRSGELPADAAVFRDREVPVCLATTDRGLERARPLLDGLPNLRWWSGGAQLNYAALVQELGSSYGVRTLLCEAGPRVYGAMLAAGVVDDEFVTLSPILAGNSAEQPRLALVEGVSFDPDRPPRSRLLALYRSGDHLFLHSRYNCSDVPSG